MIIQEFNTFAVMQYVGNQSLYSLLCFWSHIYTYLYTYKMYEILYV